MAISQYRRIGVLLNRQRGRGVADEQRQRTLARAGAAQELRRFARDVDKACAAGLHSERGGDNVARTDR